MQDTFIFFFNTFWLVDKKQEKSAGMVSTLWYLKHSVLQPVEFHLRFVLLQFGFYLLPPRLQSSDVSEPWSEDLLGPERT